LLLALCPACASSVLVGANDTTFDRAQQRLQNTAAVVEALGPPRDERTLFLQAESFYQYRFAPPPRGGLSYAAEAAAAITDFPALQAFAASVDLVELRLRASDSAVQLWESLLARHPHSVLRPLTLYKLGWAYRSIGVTGLPRSSRDEAFDALAAEAPGTPLAAWAQQAKAVPFKKKSTAAGLSLVPGLGQFYVGEKLSGATRLAVALAALAAITIPVYIAFERRTDLTWQRDWPLLATSVAGLVALSVDYTSSYEDAMRGVVLSNERSEASFQDGHPGAP
jgi:hypothetical protein